MPEYTNSNACAMPTIKDGCDVAKRWVYTSVGKDRRWRAMSPCENCKMNRLCKELDALGYASGCNTLHPIRKTNADRIRAMTNEELAEFITGAAYDFVERPGMCDVCDTVTVQHCEECWLDWLKQEAESDG